MDYQRSTEDRGQSHARIQRQDRCYGQSTKRKPLHSLALRPDGRVFHFLARARFLACDFTSSQGIRLTVPSFISRERLSISAAHAASTSSSVVSLGRK